MKITDEQLDTRAAELSFGYVKSIGRSTHSVHYYAFHRATRAALEVNRESLRVGLLWLDLYEQVKDQVKIWPGEIDTFNEANDAHITTLRKRLGIEP